MGFTEVNYSFQKREKYLQEVVHSSGGRHSQVKTRPSSDSEAATMYKLKGQSSNMQTGRSFEH